MSEGELQDLWRQTMRNLDAPIARRGERMRLTRVSGDTLHLATREPATQSTADKLSRALYEAWRRPVAVVLVQPLGIPLRSYCDSRTVFS